MYRQMALDTGLVYGNAPGTEIDKTGTILSADHRNVFLEVHQENEIAAVSQHPIQR